MFGVPNIFPMNRTKHCSLLVNKFFRWTNYKTNHVSPDAIFNRACHHATFGQPVHSTHPHLISPGEVLTGISLKEVKLRRQTFLHALRDYAARQIGAATNHIVIIPSANKKYMSHKIPYVFRQNTDFLYLSGCQEPDSVLVLEVDSNNNCKNTIFVRPKDKTAEMWDGPRTGVQFAQDVFGVEESFDINCLKEYLTKYGFANPNSIYWYDEKASDLADVSKMVRDVTNNQTKSPIELIQSLRLIKSESECVLMRKTCEIASKAINTTLENSYPGISEHEIYANVDYYTRINGANFLAYPPVVAGGSNATIIHYINNNQIVKGGELILMDAGCEYHGYTSDITRTWPVDGKFSDAHRVLYEVLLQVQKELLDCLQYQGGETLDQLFDTMCSKIGKYLQEIKLIPSSLSGLELSRAAYKFCPHHVSHYLGMDVHDTPLISRNIRLCPGMVCTVEPGIYIPTHKLDVPSEFRGVGLRIEDDVLIKPRKEIEILTKECVKDSTLLEDLVSCKTRGSLS
ncbi:xaa-Pro aminopeptidase 3-like [Anopheles marshallii]|uniref:xaa-Pro aminopeptidase 3-like n=1 Tax=Anopheles marshallii TaxID=1521116 RepID=UPI00237C3FA5|nr:xaa-Pro aminopeptidase 3-like [Anopheles marshallii]